MPAAAFAQVAGPQRVSGLLPHLAPGAGAPLCTPPRTGRPGRPWQPGACLQRRSWCADSTLCLCRLWALVPDSRVTEETSRSSVLVALGHEEKTAVRHGCCSLRGGSGSAALQWEAGFLPDGPGVALPSSSPPQQRVPTSLFHDCPALVSAELVAQGDCSLSLPCCGLSVLSWPLAVTVPQRSQRLCSR